MIREAPRANRYVEEAENERQYQKHVNAIKNMKPSINTHAEIKNKDKKLRNPRVRIFNGQTALNNGNQPMATTGLRKDKISEKHDRRPKTAMNFIDLKLDIENDNENEVFSTKKHKKTTDAELCSISENSSSLSDAPNKKKQNINDNSSSPDKKDITEFDIFSINSAKSQAEKEREEITTNLYHPYIPANSARTKSKTAKTEIQQQPLSAKKSRIPLSRQDNPSHGNNVSAAQGVKKVSSAGSIPKNTISNKPSKTRIKPKTEQNSNTNSNNDDIDNTSTNNVGFKPQKVSSARRKTKNDTNHPHMTQIDKQQIQAQQRQQQRILKQQQEKLERQERLEKLEKQKKKISANPSSSQIPSSPSSPVSNKNDENKISKSPNSGSKSPLTNKKSTNEIQNTKNDTNAKKFFQTEISISKTKTKKNNEERLSKTENDNDDSFLPCQPLFAEPAPKVTFGADMWDTSDDEDEDEDEDENENTNLTTDTDNPDQFEIKKGNSFSSNDDIELSDKNILDDIESDNGIHDDFVCSDDFSSDNDF